MSKYFFSIIIPAYQSQNYITDAIQSVLLQEFTCYEIIVVDDGSTDNTINCVKALKDERIIYYSITHSGTQKARYYGIQKAQGEYLIFLDADDRLTANALSVIFQNITDNPCDLYVGGMSFIDINGVNSQLNKEAPYGYLDKKELFIMMTDKRQIKSLARKVLKKEFALYTGEMIKKHLITYGEDMFFSMDMLLKVQSIYVSHDVMYEYILRKDGTMNRFNINKYRDRYLMYEAIKYYGRLLEIEQVAIHRIAEIYLIKQFTDCLIEIDAQNNEENIAINTMYQEVKRKIVIKIKEHSDIVMQYDDDLSKNQRSILKKYEVY